MDKLSQEIRSQVMSRIRGKNTKPEMEVRSLLHRLRYRFRLHCRDLPGTPDIVMSSRRTLIFVQGCFWHRHEGCRDSGIPKSNTEFWLKKLEGNVVRDKRNHELLLNMGWQVIIVWECETSDMDMLSERLKREILQPNPPKRSTK